VHYMAKEVGERMPKMDKKHVLMWVYNHRSWTHLWKQVGASSLLFTSWCFSTFL
jgi:hypothetical protein